MTPAVFNVNKTMVTIAAEKAIMLSLLCFRSHFQIFHFLIPDENCLPSNFLSTNDNKNGKNRIKVKKVKKAKKVKKPKNSKNPSI